MTKEQILDIFNDETIAEKTTEAAEIVTELGRIEAEATIHEQARRHISGTAALRAVITQSGGVTDRRDVISQNSGGIFRFRRFW
jgi:hypothetical protein